MERHTFLSSHRRLALLLSKLIVITAALLSATGSARAQSPVDLRINSYSFSSVRLGDGRDIEFVITVYIEQKRQASGVVVTAELPAGVIFSSAKTDHGRCDFADGLITCNLGVVGREGLPTIDWAAYIQIFVRPTEAGQVALTSQITANEPDPNLSNNTTTTMRTATVSPPKSRKRARITT